MRYRANRQQIQAPQAIIELSAITWPTRAESRMAYSLFFLDEQVAHALQELADLPTEQAVRLLRVRLLSMQGRSKQAEVQAILKLDEQQETQDPTGYVARTGLLQGPG